MWPEKCPPLKLELPCPPVHNVPDKMMYMKTNWGLKLMSKSDNKERSQRDVQPSTLVGWASRVLIQKNK